MVRGQAKAGPFPFLPMYQNGQKGIFSEAKLLYISLVNNNQTMKEYSLDCPYYTRTFSTLDDLLRDIIMTGMDPDYEITVNGKGIGQAAVEFLQY